MKLPHIKEHLKDSIPVRNLAYPTILMTFIQPNVHTIQEFDTTIIVKYLRTASYEENLAPSRAPIKLLKPIPQPCIIQSD